ncbi:hypothetical protein [Spirulina subsalsa]|uniref:hypothetical protein n=1 Tax=Spirulina subsalsa TaxID=54311 RepID=UPI0002FA9AAF|nr:hypothetical protein [Spirulina subsalsa]
MTILYEDEYIVCDDDAITIHYYYFPLGSKRIPYREIRKVETEPMTWWAGGLRIWGGNLAYWFHLDPKRPWKEKLIIIDEGDWTKPVITPEDHPRVWQILQEKTNSF